MRLSVCIFIVRSILKVVKPIIAHAHNKTYPSRAPFPLIFFGGAFDETVNIFTELGRRQ
jgi:hypothetical protein